jgi:hypothetical protein
MREIDWCEGGLPSSPSPWSPDTDEGDHGAVRASVLSGYQVDSRVGNDYPPVFVQGRDLENLAVQSAALHRVIESPPMQGPKDRGNHDIETSPQRVVRRMTHDARDRITPLMDDALTVDGHGCATVMGRLESVHAVSTTRAVTGFTDAPISRHRTAPTWTEIRWPRLGSNRRHGSALPLPSIAH